MAATVKHNAHASPRIPEWCDRDKKTLIGSVFERERKLFQLKLTASGISWHPHLENSLPNSTLSEYGVSIPLSEIVTVNAKPAQPECHHGQSDAMEMQPCRGITIYFIKRGKNHKWKLQTVTFHGQDSSTCQSWVDKVKQLLQEHGRPQHLLIFINPVGGKRLARKIFKEKVAPYFDLAGIEQTIIVTERANHAYDYLLAEDLSGFDGVISVGGDGMVSEIINGVLKRQHKSATVSETSVTDHATAVGTSKSHLSVGIIPAGSTDTIVYCVQGINDATTSALHIVVGDQLPLDICSVWHSGQFLKYCISMAGYGFLGDVAKESEQLRWLGPKRYDMAGFKTFLANRVYEGEVSYRQCAEEISSPKEWSRCLAGCGRCASIETEANEDSVDGQEWKTINGRFISVVGANITCKCAKATSGISPNAHLGDGNMDLIMIRKASRYQYFRQMHSMAYKGEPFDFSFVEVCRVKEFKFTPLPSQTHDSALIVDSNRRSSRSSRRRHSGSWNIDGEVIGDPSLHFRVHRQLIQVYGRGIEQLEETTMCKPCHRGSINEESTL